MKVEQVLQSLIGEVSCSLKKHTIELDGIEIQQNLNVEPFDAIELIEVLWQEYYNSVPDSKKFSPIPTKPRSEFSYSDFVTASNRSEVQWRLEVAIVLAYWTKSFPEFEGFYWRSSRFPALVLFRQWLL